MNSVICAFFALLSQSINTQGLEGNAISMEDFVASNYEMMSHPTMTLWNNLFILYTTLTHAVILLLVCSVSSFEFTACCFLITFMVFSTLLSPKLQLRGVPPYLIYSLIYLIFVGYTIHYHKGDVMHISFHFLVFIGFLDVFVLYIGHTWDPTPDLKTILNCRIIYAACSALIVIFAYTQWHA